VPQRLVIACPNVPRLVFVAIVRLKSDHDGTGAEGIFALLLPTLRLQYALFIGRVRHGVCIGG